MNDRESIKAFELDKAFSGGIGGPQYLVLGPATDDPNQIDLMARKVAKNFN